MTSRPSILKIDWTQYNVKSIKGELIKRGLRRGGKKQALIDRLTAVIDQEKFTLFEKLPPEMRDKIWKAALPARRVVRTFLGYGPRDVNTLHRHSVLGLPSVFSIMAACREARQIVINRYKPRAKHTWAHNPCDRHLRRIYFSPNDDIFWLAFRNSSLVSILDEFATKSLIKVPKSIQGNVFIKIRTFAMAKVHFEILLDGSSLAEKCLQILSTMSHVEQIIIQGGIKDASNDGDEWSLPIQPRGRYRHELGPTCLSSYSDIPPTPAAEAVNLKWQEKCEVLELLQLKRIKLLFAMF